MLERTGSDSGVDLGNDIRAAADGVIHLGIGHLEDRLLPWAELGRAAELCFAGEGFAADGQSLLQYAPEEGDEGARRAIADFIERRTGVRVPVSELMLSAGASHGLDLLLSKYTRPGDPILVEDPSYFFGLEVLAGRGLRLLPVPMDDEGLDVEALERLAVQENPRLLYTIPVHHNPTGATLSPERRRRLIEVARSHDILIVADEVYQMVSPDGAKPAPLRQYGSDHVVSLGSFSKIFAPGLRLGWIEAAPRILDVLRTCPVTRSGGGPAPVQAAIMRHALESGIQDEFLDRIIGVYQKRRECMVETLESELPPDVRFHRPDGGYYVWLTLPDGIDTAILEHKAMGHGVGFRAGPDFSVNGNLRNCLRLCFAYYDEQHIETGVRRLGEVLRSYM